MVSNWFTGLPILLEMIWYYGFGTKLCFICTFQPTKFGFLLCLNFVPTFEAFVACFIKIGGHIGQLPQRRYFGNGKNQHQPWLLSGDFPTRRGGQPLRGKMKADIMNSGFEFLESDELKILILTSKTEVDESFEGLAIRRVQGDELVFERVGLITLNGRIYD